MKEVIAWAETLTLPAAVFVYGPERTHRTRFRGENPGGYGSAVCSTPQDVWNLIDGCKFQMPLSELTISAVQTAEDGPQIVEM